MYLMLRVRSVSLGMSLSLQICTVLLIVSVAYGQSAERPNREELFFADTEGEQDRRSKQLEGILQQDKAVSNDLDFRAPDMEFLQEEKRIKGAGGVLISKEGLQVQADEATFHTETKDAQIAGNILFNWPAGSISCESADVNLDSETGVFEEAQVTMEDGEYGIASRKLFKVTEFDYKVEHAEFSTCHCPDGYKPWFIACSRGKAREEGYAHVRNAWVNLFDVPIFYSPYLVFPVKTERASGLLVPQYGYSSEDGVRFSIPLFLVVNDYSDITLRPFLETKTRAGVAIDYRHAFSRYHNLESRFYYSNESQRDGDLRGTVVDGLEDPTFDEDRFAGFYQHVWRTEPGSALPTTFIADIHLVGDDLFPREIDDPKVVRSNARFATSKAVLRSSAGGLLNAEIAGEYNQSLLTDDDLIFQRLPEASLQSRKSFRPFGFNPYGLKVSTGAEVQATNFTRDDGFEGWRYNLTPSLKIPYHYKNYLNGEFRVDFHKTLYDLNDKSFPGTDPGVVTDDERGVFEFNYDISTGLERVFELERNNIWTRLTSLGAKNQDQRLRRVKHTIEPFIGYTFVPETDQEGLPLFDSFDRFRNKSVISYGARTSILGRFAPLDPGGEAISELTPEVEDIPVLEVEQALADFGAIGESEAGQKVKLRKGAVRKLATIGLRQTYDYIEDKELNTPDRSPFSDVAFDFAIYPSQSFAFEFDSDYDAEEQDFSSWSIATHFKDDRGDSLRARYTFIEDSVSQLESSLELVLADRLKLGYYARFDEDEGSFIDNQVALRVISACNCWYLDVGLRDETNPDKRQALLSFTFKGLGDIAQDLSFGNEDR